MTVLQALSIVLILSTLGLLWIKRIATAIKILSIQSLILGMMAMFIARQTGTVDLYIMAGLTILMKAIGIPWILWYTLRKIGGVRETEKLIGRELSLLCGGGLLAIGYIITSRLHISAPNLTREYLPISIAMLLIGLFIMMTHQKAIMQGIGLVVMENGLFLVALVTTYGMPFLVDIGVFLDVFVAVILMSMLTYRIDKTFQSTHTENLRRLRG
ncbi:hydrogenase [Alicyclobacillus fastidiosus]|uniref:Hydrogenase n=1 Tax=Alicyclobacillus fastidiosus TaxID=392011 RepID=A0ABV5AHY7_9BACL|nr:hydrogenase [Alicyclobacillus fastidiosus]WEH10079.1 hydrogenase [Alicyclobacillus fastidiosus]